MTAKKTTKAEPAAVPQGIAEAAARVKAASEAHEAAIMARIDAVAALKTAEQRVLDAETDMQDACAALVQAAQS